MRHRSRARRWRGGAQREDARSCSGRIRGHCIRSRPWRRRRFSIFAPYYDDDDGRAPTTRSTRRAGRRAASRRFVGRGARMATAILLVESRGQSVHCREDSCVNLVQAAWLARELVRAGVDVRMRLIADAGQSIPGVFDPLSRERRSDRLPGRIATAANPRETRYGIVRELRARLPFSYDAVPPVVSSRDAGFFIRRCSRGSSGVNESCSQACEMSPIRCSTRRARRIGSLIDAHVARPTSISTSPWPGARSPSSPAMHSTADRHPHRLASR